MAVGNVAWPDLAPIAGVKLGVTAAGIKYSDRQDFGVILLDEGARVAGVFTQNAYAAAPVIVCRQHLSQSGNVRALLVNSGNANACTGESGMQAAIRSCEKIADINGFDASQALPFSTGVIGEDLPIEKIEAALPQACESASEDLWFDFAKCIMTTDTRPKGASVVINVEGAEIRINGVSKGAGMINPNMATMLAFVATDANISQEMLDLLSKEAAYESFNRITIDGDTSTNDSCVLMATGKSSAPLIDDQTSPAFSQLKDALIEVYRSLAQQIVMDGEGATKFVSVDVQGGANAQESLGVAYAIAHSPLVKTALFASDPNWGRIVCAIGYSGLPELDASKIRVWLDEVLIVENGGKASSYTEELGQSVFDKEEFTIRVDLGRGSAREQLWTSDLSHEYVRINAEYRS